MCMSVCYMLDVRSPIHEHVVSAVASPQVATAFAYGAPRVRRRCTAALRYAKVVADTIPEVRQQLQRI